MRGTLIFFIHLHQYILSPIIVGVLGNRGICRFHPSCSEYAIKAISQHGLRRGILLSFKRIFRCRPGVLGGYDPVAIPHI